MAKLNINIPNVVSGFEYAMKKQLLFKNVFYKKVFGGKGFEFDSYRNYDSNDDSSIIDWKASMRSGNTLVRQFVEERDTSVLFLLDVGDNMLLGSGNKLKLEVALEIVASISHLIISSGDSVGLALYSDNLVRVIMPGGGMKQFYNIVNTFDNTSLFGGKSNLKNALTFLEPRLKKVSAVFVISDFLRVDPTTLEVLRRFMLRHETIGVMLRDNVDDALPDINNEIIIEDIDSGEQILVNPRLIKANYGANAQLQKKEVFETFKRAGADVFELLANNDFIGPLSGFLKSRAKKRTINKFNS